MRVKRRSQIMRNVITDITHAGHQTFDLIEHGVKIGAQMIELIAGAGFRNTLR